MASALVSLISDVRLVVKDVSWLGTAALICIGTFAVSSLVITRRQRNRKRNLVSGDFALPEVAAAKEAGEMLKTAKVDNPKVEFKVWCGICHIRLASNEERALVRGKTYHPRCYTRYLDLSRRD
jgi:hypothetical protein